MIIVEIVYFVTAVLLSIYGFHSLLMTGLFLKYKRQNGQVPTEPIDHLEELVSLPRVTVQLPIYNERHVASRLLDAVVKLDWPSDRLQIQILDDSTDDTVQIVAAQLSRYQDSGLCHTNSKYHQTIDIYYISFPLDTFLYTYSIG